MCSCCDSQIEPPQQTHDEELQVHIQIRASARCIFLRAIDPSRASLCLFIPMPYAQKWKASISSVLASFERAQFCCFHRIFSDAHAFACNECMPASPPLRRCESTSCIIRHCIVREKGRERAPPLAPLSLKGSMIVSLHVFVGFSVAYIFTS